MKKLVIEKPVKVETPHPVTKLPAHERAARQRRVLTERPAVTHKSVPRLKALEPLATASFPRHHLSS